MTNLILKELRDIRRQILAEHSEDLASYIHVELEKTKASGHPVANIKQRTIRRSEAAMSDVSAMAGHSAPPSER